MTTENIEQALKLIREKYDTNEVAKTTCDCLDNNRIKIRSLLQLTQRDRRVVEADIKYMSNSVGNNVCTDPDIYFDGYIHYNNIYVSTRLSPEQVASVIIHEIRHFLDDAYCAASELDKIYVYEKSAREAEFYFQKKYLTRLQAKIIHQAILEDHFPAEKRN